MNPSGLQWANVKRIVMKANSVCILGILCFDGEVKGPLTNSLFRYNYKYEFPCFAFCVHEYPYIMSLNENNEIPFAVAFSITLMWLLNTVAHLFSGDEKNFKQERYDADTTGNAAVEVYALLGTFFSQTSAAHP